MQLKQWIAVFTFCIINLNSGNVWCQGSELAFDTVKTKDGIILVPYKKREIVVDFTGADPILSGKLKDYLTKEGFHLGYTCPCQDSLEIWVSNDPEFDPIGVVEGAQGRGNASGGEPGMSLNFALDTLETPSTESSGSTLLAPTHQLGEPIVKIAVLDTGVDPNTNFGLLNDALRNGPGPGGCRIDDTPLGWDVPTFRKIAPIDQNGHGTHVNGIIAGIPDAMSQHQTKRHGVHLEILNVKITDAGTASGYLSNAICGMYYALKNKAQILNLSWGFRDASIPAAMVPFLKSANANNILIVAGAGNDGDLIDASEPLKFWPAGFAQTRYGVNVISVGAYNQNGEAKKRASFSNYGNADIFAPGVKINSSYLGKQKTAIMSGTSMAAPFVTRTAAFIIGSHRWINAKQVKRCILDSATWSVLDQPLNPDPVIPRDDKLHKARQQPKQKPVNIKILNPNLAIRCGNKR